MQDTRNAFARLGGALVPRSHADSAQHLSMRAIVSASTEARITDLERSEGEPPLPVLAAALAETRKPPGVVLGGSFVVRFDAISRRS